jgi:hypothetical protein
MPEARTFEYAVLRVVPRVERGEFVNAGVILYCRSQGFLQAAIELDATRLLALAPDLDVPQIAAHLESVARICRGGPEAGPIGELAQAERFRWLTAPRSTSIQSSEVHEGICDDPAAALEQAMRTHVRQSRPGMTP